MRGLSRPQTLLIRTGAFGGILFFNAACQPDIGELEPPPDPAIGNTVIAQFEPSHPIPQLRLVPSPTALAQNADGTINFDAVAPAACEGSTTAQCLAFVEGWPINLLPTLNFSAPLEEDTLSAGIQLFEVAPSGALTKLENLSYKTVTRPLPPDACKEGDNNSLNNSTFTDEDISDLWGSEYVDLVVTPEGGLFKPDTTYIIVATRDLRGQPQEGESTARRVEASSLFYLLNQKGVFNEQGELVSGALLTEIRSTTISQLFPGQSYTDLSTEELAVLQQVMDATISRIRGLYQFVNQVTSTLVTQNAIARRDDIVMANIWTTGATPAVASLDPQSSQFPDSIQVPFPNDPLFLSTQSGNPQVSIAVPDDASEPVQNLAAQINSLNGFGMHTPIIIPTSRDIDPTSLEGNIVIVELDSQNAPIATFNDIIAGTTRSSPSQTSSILIQPSSALKPNTTYVIGLTTGITSVDGTPITASSTFNLMKYPAPLISEEGTAPPELKNLLECATLSATGELADADTIAARLEVGLNHPRWLVATKALAQLDPAIEPEDVVMAFPYTTQSLTQPLDSILPNLPGPTVLSAQPRDIEDDWLRPLCNGLALDNVDDEALCTSIIESFGTGFEAQSISLAQFTFTAGSPLTGGGFFTRESVTNPSVGPMEVLFITPSEPAPADGWPTVIFQHGLEDSKESAFLLAKTITDAGYAIAAIDLPYFGTRTLTQEACPTDNCQSGDGFISLNLLATRDSFHQATIDSLTLLSYLQDTTVQTNSGLPIVDTSRISYLGQSLGGMSVANLQAYLSENEIAATVINAAGGGIFDFLESSTSAAAVNFFRSLYDLGICQLPDDATTYNPAETGEFGCLVPTPTFGIFKLMAQWVFEPSNPVVSASAITTELPGRPITTGSTETLLLQSIDPDTYIPQATSNKLAAAYGIEDSDQYQTISSSELPSSEWTPGCHSYLSVPTCGACYEEALCQTVETQSQAMSYLIDLSIVDQPLVTLPDAGELSSIDCSNPCGSN